MKLSKMMMLGTLVAGMSLASSVMAGYTVTTGYSGSGFGPWQTGQGGEFTVQPNTGVGSLYEAVGSLSFYSSSTKNIGVTPSFQTFCIELNEHIDGNTTYNASLQDYAYGPPANPVSSGTAWLYSQFARGTLTGYDYANSGVGRKVSAQALQDALWFLEGQTSMTDAAFSANIFGSLLLSQSQFTSITVAKADAGLNNYGTKILHLEDGQRGKVQDLLVLVPDSGMTLALLGMAFTGLGMFGRRFRK